MKLSAQQQSQFTHYMYNTIAVNPAYAGSRGALAIVGVNRNQWVGFEGGPRTTTLSVHSPLRNENLGLGLSLMNDQSGYENFSYAYADFAYTIKTNEETFLTFGLKGGFSHYKIDPELFGFTEVMDDPFFNDKLNRWTPNFGVGLYYHSSKWYIGASSPKLISNDYNRNDTYVALERNHYYLLGGYVLDISNNVKLKPSFLVRATSGAPMALDLTGNFLFYEKVWVGGSYRVNDSIGAIFDVKLSQNFRIGYAYEYPLSDISPYTQGSHEVLLIYEFKYNFSRYKSPRYF